MESNHQLTNKAQTVEYLTKLGLEFKNYDHAESKTMQELAEHVKLDHSPLIKNLFYKAKKKYFMVLAHVDTKVLKGFWRDIKVNPKNARMGSPNQMKELLGVQPGHVNPFGLVNDVNKKITLVFDEKLKEFSHWAFHPMECTALLEMTQEDFIQKFLHSLEREELFLDLTKEVVVEAKQQKQGKQGKKGKKQQQKKKKGQKKQTKLNITEPKNGDFSEWYTQLITKSEMIEYYDISGCYILRPWSFSIWEKIQTNFDVWIKKLGVQNSYFPLFISEKALMTEKDHIEGFAPEVAWVTMAGEKKMDKRIAIRPTSETIMYPAYSKWVKSHRDLPILLNQWNSVVRWEFKQPTPFLRSREFLWQEGHTAHASFEEADKMVFDILELYKRLYVELLAVPVVQGIKTEKEKFPGGDMTTTIETWIPQNGRGIQACTSHHLGQNFAKMFKIQFEDKDKKTKFAHQTSWGFTTRSIGIMIMIHGDDKGLVLPPKVAQYQVVIIPVFFKNSDQKAMMAQIDQLYFELKRVGVRAYVDDRDNCTPGFKYNHWEVKGVPLRIELGPKDFENKEFRVVKRNNGKKYNISRDAIIDNVQHLLKEIQLEMYVDASKKIDKCRRTATNWKDFLVAINDGCVVDTLWCDERELEDQIHEKSRDDLEDFEPPAGRQKMTGGVKTLCKPIDKNRGKIEGKCFFSGKPAKCWVLWGRSY